MVGSTFLQICIQVQQLVQHETYEGRSKNYATIVEGAVRTILFYSYWQ